MESPAPRPPRISGLLARLLLRGAQGRLIRADLDDAFVRDLDKGIPQGRARRRYAVNLMGSVWSVWTGALRRLVTRGAGLDAKLGLRMLGKQPMLTGVAMLALGLGIPSTLATNHIMDAFLSPIPVPDGERVMGIRYWDREIFDPVMSSVHDWARWREGLGSFETVGAAQSSLLNVSTGEPGVAPVRGSRISAGGLALLRTPPLLGRLFGAEDEVRGARDVVIVSEDLWTNRFGRDPQVLGATVRVNGQPHDIVGVMPRSFRFPVDDDVWLPLRASPADYAVGEGPELWVFGRLAPGVSTEAASLEMELATARAIEDDPMRLERVVGEIVEMPLLLLGEDRIQGDAELLLFQALVLVMLLIVCGNVGVLILARTATRTGELSIRTALGASRGRIVGQLFVEALVLALVATGTGLLLAELLVRWLMGTVAPFGSIPYWMDLGLTPRTVVLALALAAASAAVAGVIPAFKATRRGVQANLQSAAAGKASLRFGAGSMFLIVSEVVLSVGFLALGGALVRSGFQDTEGQLGFEPERYVSASVRVPWLDPAEHPEYADAEAFARRVRETQREVLVRLAADEAVIGVGAAVHIPGNDGPRIRVIPEAGPNAGAPNEIPIGVSRVDVEFFRGLGRPILAGRDFSSADVEGEHDGHRSAVIVNTTFVEQVLGGQNPIGQRFVGEEEDEYEIVGLVGRFGTNPLNPTLDAAIYHPMAPGEANPLRYMIGVTGDAAAYGPRLREIVAAVDPHATVTAGSTMRLLETEARVFRGIFLGQVVLAAVAFLLSITGLYALMSFTVAQRTREIGIRTALGARAWSIAGTIGRRAALQLGLGLALGAVWAWVLLQGFQNDAAVAPIHVPLTIGLTVALAAMVGIAACAGPTLRCLRIQPTEALRES